MNRILMDLKGELMYFIKGKTIDALLPPILLLIALQFFTLYPAGVLTLIYCLAQLIFRATKKAPLAYSLLGFVGVVIALGFTLIVGSYESYFLPGIITAGFFLTLCVVSLLLNRPLAAWLSHMTRGWPTDWFWRSDVLPAYRQVTFLWAILLLLRLGLLLIIYRYGSASEVLMTNLLLGTPATIIVLAISYIYGTIALRKLQGPSVDEFLAKTPPPWQGQRKGF